MEEGEWENERKPSTFPLPSSSLTDAGNISGRAPMLPRPSLTRPILTPLTWMAFMRLTFNASGLFNTLDVLFNNFPTSLLDVRNHYWTFRIGRKTWRKEEANYDDKSSLWYKLCSGDWCSMRSMAVLSSRAHERRSREKNKNCSRPNLLAVSLPSPAFIT